MHSALSLLRAKKTNPFQWLCSVFPDVKLSRSGRHIRVQDTLRADMRQGGIWVSCDWYGGGIGDNISLVRMFSGCDFSTAVNVMCNESTCSSYQASPPPPVIKTRPTFPHTCAPHKGRNYLMGRDISKNTIQEAERNAVIDYVHNGVMFIGRDEHGSPRLLSLRFYNPLPPKPGFKKPMTKLDLEGSNKSYPVLLRGNTPELAIVEGGVNMLAVRDILSEYGNPSIMSTGGVGVRGFLQNPMITDIVRNSACIMFFWENEMREGLPCAEKQEKTDFLRYAMLNAITEISPYGNFSIIKPPPFCKDAAEWNTAILNGATPPFKSSDAENYAVTPNSFSIT